MRYKIYMHKNLINNKVYIGQTRRSLNKRFNHGKGYFGSPHFNAAILKYGWDNFEHIILEEGEWTPEEVNEKEKYYILLYNSCDPEFGYNIKEGGSVQAIEFTSKQLEKKRERGLHQAKIMLQWQQEHPEEMLKMRRENAAKAADARKKPVLCVETNIVYESATAAAKTVPGTTQGKICMVCRGQRNTCGGFHWKYYNEEINNG